MTFVEALNSAMSLNGLSQADLSRLSGANSPYLSRLLSGKIKEPSWLKACAIIDALGMTLDEFRALQLGKEPPSYCPADAGQVDLDGYYASMNDEARRTLVDSARLMSGNAEARVEKKSAEHPAAEEAV